MYKMVSFFILNLIFLFPAFAKEQLVFAVDIIRHGDRNPIVTLQGDNWPNGAGQLTPEGMAQEFRLGQRMREYYINQQHLLPPHYSFDTMYVEATTYPRTVMSAQSFLYGLYPLGTGPLLPNNTTPALPEAYQPIPIFTIPAQYDKLLLAYASREKLKQLIMKYVFPLPSWQTQQLELAAKYPQWSQITGTHLSTDNPLQTILLGDTIFIEKLHKTPLPKNLSVEEAQAMITAAQWTWLTIYANPQIAIYGGQNLLTNITAEFKKALDNKNSLKYILYSAHDTTIATQLTLLGSPARKMIPYASRLNYSLFKTDDQQYYVKVTYNDEPLVVKHCGSNKCTLAQFEALEKNIKLEAQKIHNEVDI